MSEELKRFKEFVRWFEELVFGTPDDRPKNKLTKRARKKDGTFRGDDKSTPDVNEAWVGGKAPKKRRKKNVKK
tara:strand:- start:353 stop:571 length:219 start_codon:yes stop_codon:yes gene_type:complete